MQTAPSVADGYSPVTLKLTVAWPSGPEPKNTRFVFISGTNWYYSGAFPSIELTLDLRGLRDTSPRHPLTNMNLLPR